MIGIIGFGRFGAFMAGHLARDFKVGVCSRSAAPGRIEKVGARAVSLAEACARKIVILSVPISAMPHMLARIAPLLKKETLVVDVCSVKTYPVAWMRRTLPETVSILATHPMFGPDSAADALAGKKIVLCRERISARRYARISAYLASRGLTVIDTSPEAHDRQIADSLCLTHFIGRALARFGAEDLRIDTDGYQRLRHVLEVVEHDSWQLFVDMHRYNPYAGERRRAFMAAMQALNEELDP